MLLNQLKLQKITLSASLLGNILAGKGIVRDGGGVIPAGKRTNRAGRNF